ncbi:MAG: fluoride efflux transporter FluC [Candidatus Acidiferrales bacterium]
MAEEERAARLRPTRERSDGEIPGGGSWRISGCDCELLVGITILAERRHLIPNWRYLIPVRFIGAYTTFSTFEQETFRVIQDGELLIAFLNVVLSVL